MLVEQNHLTVLHSKQRVSSNDSHEEPPRRTLEFDPRQEKKKERERKSERGITEAKCPRK